jgi:hypothetical protein
MSTKYVLCQHCKKSNPIEDPDRFEQNCIFCGRPFIIPKKKVTQLVSEPIEDQRKMIPDTVQPNQLEDVNQTKPVNKNKTQPLR